MIDFDKMTYFQRVGTMMIMIMILLVIMFLVEGIPIVLEVMFAILARMLLWIMLFELIRPAIANMLTRLAFFILNRNQPPPSQK